MTAAVRSRRVLVAVGVTALVGAIGAAWLVLRADAASCAIAGAVTWDGGANTTSWEDAANWSTNQVPGPTNHVCIPSSANGTFVAVNSAETVLSVEAQKQVRIFSSLEVTSTTQASQFKSMKLTGNLLGAGARTFSGTLTWNFGQISGPGITTVNVGGTLALSTPFFNFLDGGTLRNNGTASMAENSFIQLSNGATVDNAGNFDLADGAQIFDNGGGTSQFINSGTLTKLTGSTIGASVSVPLDNDGTIRVGSGQLFLGDGSGVATGVFEAGGGALLSLGGTYTLGGSPQVKGAGIVEISGTVSGTFSLNVSGTARISGTVDGSFSLTTPAGGTLELTGQITGAGNRTISGTFNWVGGAIRGPGTTTIAAGGTLNVTNGGCSCHELDGGVLQNSGTASMAANTYIGFLNGAVLANAGSLSLTDGAQLYDGDGLGNQVTNTGTLTKLTDTDPDTDPSAFVSVPFDNDGTVLTSSGTLELSDGSGSGHVSTGIYEAGGGALLGLGSDHTLGGSPQVKGAGIVEISGTVSGTFSLNVSGTARISGTVDGSFSLTTPAGGTLELTGQITGAGNRTISGTFNWVGGAIRGPGTTTIAAGGTLNVTNGGCSCHELDGGVLQNSGTASMAANTYIGFLNGAVLANAGSLSLTDGAQLYDGDGLGNQVTNTGTLTKLTDTDPDTDPSAFVSVPFDNDGTVLTSSGTLELSDGSGSGHVSTGIYEAGGGALLGLGSDHTLGGSPQVKGAGIVEISGTVSGTFSLNVSGTARISGTVDGSFSLTTPAGGTLELTGQITGAGNRTISGTFNWVGGAIRGPGTTTIAAGGTLNVTNGGCSCHELDGGVLQNSGTASMAANTYIGFLNGAVLANAGSLSLTDGAQLYDGDGLGNQVTNTGTLTKLTDTDPDNPASVGVAFTNSGTVRVSSGVLDVGSEFQQSATGTIAFPLRGTTPGTNFGQLRFGSAAPFDGRLKLERMTGFNPPMGTTFDVIAYPTNSRTGNFSSIQGASISAVKTFRAHYEGDRVAIVVEPSAPLANKAITVSKTVSLERSTPNTCNQNFNQSCATVSTVNVSAPSYGGHPNAPVMIVLCNLQLFTLPTADGTGGNGDPLGACDFGNGLGLAPAGVGGLSGSVNLDGSGNLPGTYSLPITSTARMTGIDGTPSPNADALCPPTPAHIAAGWTCAVVIAEYDPNHPGRTPAAIGIRNVFLRSPVPTVRCGGSACPNPTTPGTVVTVTGNKFPCKVITPDNTATATYDGACVTRWGASADMTILLKHSVSGATQSVTPSSRVTNVNGNYTLTFTMPALTNGSGLYQVITQAGACSGACETGNFEALAAAIQR